MGGHISSMGEKPKTTAKTTETSLEVVNAIIELSGATIDELSEYLGLSTSTVHRHLLTLQNYSYVVRNGSEYEIGLQFLTIGGYARFKFRGFPIIKQKVDQLAKESGERAQFIVEEQGERIYLYTQVGESAVQTGAYPGKRGPMHTSAAGKAILANINRKSVDKIIDEHGLSETGPNSIDNREDLFDELELIRDQGYATNKQETSSGVRAIGSAVVSENNDVIGALSISGPANRITGDRFNEILPNKILGTVNEIELHIEHSTYSSQPGR